MLEIFRDDATHLAASTKNALNGNQIFPCFIKDHLVVEPADDAKQIALRRLSSGERLFEH